MCFSFRKRPATRAIRTRWRTGFSLVEVLVTMVLVLAIFALVGRFLGSLGSVWKRTGSDPFADAAQAFDEVADSLTAACLAPHVDYVDAAGHRVASSNTGGSSLLVCSDLAFICACTRDERSNLLPPGTWSRGSALFFTRAGTSEGNRDSLIAQGYFLVFGPESNLPGFLGNRPERRRWRLKQITHSGVDFRFATEATSDSWAQDLGASLPAPRDLAENIILFLAQPKGDPGATPLANYDSRTLHPPVLPTSMRLVMVALDEASGTQLAAQSGSAAPDLVAEGAFQDPANLASDLADLRSLLTRRHLRHRVFQRDVALPIATFSP